MKLKIKSLIFTGLLCSVASHHAAIIAQDSFDTDGALNTTSGGTGWLGG